MLDSIRTEMADTTARPLRAQVEPIDLSEQRLETLNSMAGPESYDGEPLPNIGPDLAGNQPDTREISLEQAIQSAVRHNLRPAGRLVFAGDQPRAVDAGGVCL